MDFRRRLVASHLNAGNRFSFGLDDVELQALRRAAEELKPSSGGDLIRFIVHEFLVARGFLTDGMYNGDEGPGHATRTEKVGDKSGVHKRRALPRG